MEGDQRNWINSERPSLGRTERVQPSQPAPMDFTEPSQSRFRPQWNGQNTPLHPPFEYIDPSQLDFEQSFTTIDSGYGTVDQTSLLSPLSSPNKNFLFTQGYRLASFPHPRLPNSMPIDKTTSYNVDGQHGDLYQAIPQTLPRKRQRIPSGQGITEFSRLPERPGKAPRVHTQHDSQISDRIEVPSYFHPRAAGRIPNIPVNRNHVSPNTYPAEPFTTHEPEATTITKKQKMVNRNTPEAEAVIITKKQKKLIKNWYKDFATAQGSGFLTMEEVNALSTLVRLPRDAIWEWINRELINGPPKVSHDPPLSERENSLEAITRIPQRAYSLTEANKHLPPDVLRLVDRYVRACQRRRTQSDGRRKVNTGPYACTSGCGYHTQRVYDWKRHEETHQPQRLWLCRLCRQNGDKNPFLVNRTDKFLRHVKDAHAGYEPERVLDASKVDFHAAFDRKCHLCTESFDNWDDKCRHVQNHYEDIEIQSREQPSIPKNQESEDDTSSSSPSDSSDSSEDDDNQPPDPGPGANRRDTTGGSGGGSGNMGGFTQFRDSGKDDSNSSTNRQPQYGAYFGSAFAASLEPTTPDILSPGAMTRMSMPFHRAGPLSLSQSVSRLSFDPSQSLVSSTIMNRIEPDQSCNTALLWVARLPYRQQSSFENGVPILTYLGHGAHGLVDTVQEYLTGKVYARKRSSTRAFPREIAIMKKMSHPHVVKYVAAYTQNASLNLIMSPVAQSTLRDHLTRSERIENGPEQIRTWVGCLASALSYIHSQRIRHADIKPHNILVRDSDVFISDFGISRVVSEPDSTSSSISPSTPFYAAMEIAERLRHGRKSDVFSLGCVVLELLTVSEGKTVAELHDYLGLSRTKRHSRDAPAYWKVQEKLISWIAMMRTTASSPAQRLWNICERMLQNQSDHRPSSSVLFSMVRRALELSNQGGCPECMPGLSLLSQARSLEPNGPIRSSGSAIARFTGIRDAQRTKNQSVMDYCMGTPDDLVLPPITGRITEIDDTETSESCATPITTPPALAASKCRCPPTLKEKGRSLSAELADVLIDYERSGNDPSSLYVLNSICALAFQCPPAYDEVNPSPIACFTFLYDSTVPQGHDDEPVELIVESQDTDGKNGTGLLQESLAPGSRGAGAFTPSRQSSTSCQQTCHQCSVPFVGRQDQCANCSHIRCEQCTAAFLTPISRCQAWPRKADSDLAAIGSHLLPPAYSLVDNRSKPKVSVQPNASLAGVESEQAVFNLVIAQNQSHGDDPVQRFIKDSPSTFDRIQEPVRNYNNEWFHPSPTVNPVLHNRASQLQPDNIAPAPPEGYLGNKRLKLDNSLRQYPVDTPGSQSPRRLRHRQSRQRISGRSKQTIRRPPLEMRFTNSTPRTDNLSVVTDPHELSRFPSHQQQHSSATCTPTSNGDAIGGAFRTRTTTRMSRTGSMGSNSSESFSYNMHRPATEEHGSGANGRPSRLDLAPTHTPTTSPPMAIPYAAFQSHHYRASQGGGDTTAFPSPSRSPSPSTSPQGKTRRRGSDDHVYGNGNNLASDGYVACGGASPTGSGGSPGGHSPKEPNLFYGRHSNAWLFNNYSITGGLKKGYYHLTHKGHGGGHGTGGARGEEGGEE